MQNRTAYLNARLLDPASGIDTTGALLVEDGRIADLGPDLFRDGAPSVGNQVDCRGRSLAPGLVDMRVQLREPGEEHKETIETAGRAAAAGGITAMVCLPNTMPVIDDVAVAESIARRGREVRLAKIFCYGAATKGLNGRELTEFGLLAEAGALGFTDGEKAVADALVMRRALSYATAFGTLVVQHPEEPSLASGGAMNEGEIASRLGLAGIPAVAEVMLIRRDLELVALTGGRYHAAHISCAASVDAIRRAKADGLSVSCDTAPHYFALNEMAVGDYRTFAKVSPPLRSEEDRAAIVAGLADGTIDAIASDHAPQDQEAKRLPFAQAEPGVVGLETLLPLVLELYHNGSMALLEALAKVTCNPADLLGLEAGRLKRGAPADLVLFDADQPWRIEEQALKSKSKNTPFDARPVQGRATSTIVDGRVIFEA